MVSLTVVGEQATFFFGTDPKQLGAVLANPGLVRDQ